jgi:hypothetical protein
MAIVCVSGAGPGIGKTAVMEMLLGATHGAHAARVRVADEVPATEAARVAAKGYGLAAVSEAGEGDEESGRLLAAGAQSVTVLMAEPRGLDAGLKAMMGRLPRGADVIVEGNAYLWAREADLAIMVIGAGPSGKGLVRVRQSVREIFPKIHIWTWNTRTDPHDEGFFEFPQALARMGFRESVSNHADYHDVNPRVAAYAGNEPFLDCVRERLRNGHV